MNQSTDYINTQTAKTLHGLFQERVKRSPQKEAYRYYNNRDKQWQSYTWQEMARQVSRWQQALAKEPLKPGDRIAIMARNCPQWAIFDQAVLGLGLVDVPLYYNDRAESVTYILKNAGVKILFIEGVEQWAQLKEFGQQMETVLRIVSFTPVADAGDPRLVSLDDWQGPETTLVSREVDPHSLATICYTSGTTGNPKGVMLSHHNILCNAYTALQLVNIYPEDLFLSFLPLSHMFERTAGYYLPMMAGSRTAYARSVPDLPEDLITIKPTILISVPRIYERIYAKIKTQLETSGIKKALFDAAVNIGWRRFEIQQGRASWTPALLLWPLLNILVAGKILAKLGGRLRFTVSGGAPLSPAVSKVFIGLGLPVLQGYGLTESSPVISVNTLESNDPASVGVIFPDTQVRIGENDELLLKGPNVMLGYWGNEAATKACIDAQAWLHTGDKARITNKHVYITGRIKEIIVLANGEKVPPADMEVAIVSDPLFEQVMVIGEAKPYLSALVVLNKEHQGKLLNQLKLEPGKKSLLEQPIFLKELLNRIAAQTKNFPGYAQIRRIAVCEEAWTVENGLITPTLKLKRAKIMAYYEKHCGVLYDGH